MKSLILLLFTSLLSSLVSGQQKYWQQQANFTINVSVNDKDRSLTGFESIEYTNHSPDTLPFIWFHLWPNAYKNDRTAFSEQLLKQRRTDFYFSKPQQKGYINQLDFKVDGSNATTLIDTDNIDIVKVVLPRPLPPGNKATVTTPFRVKLPYNFSRAGYTGKDLQVSQWFPKPAVYDQKGWHPMPYLDQGEFYSEFGSYDVQITAPSSYVIAATGVLQDAVTLNDLKQKGRHSTEGPTKTWHFKQNNIHDFAWFANKDFNVLYDSVVLPSGKSVDIFSYFQPKSKGWNESTAYAKDGIKKYSSWIGDYPYGVVSIVHGSKNENSGGMEYPTIAVITSQDTGRDLDAVIVHEIGHNWFYGALASNERRYPWMDEGINTFYEKRYLSEKYPGSSYLKKFPFQQKLPTDEEATLLATIDKLHKDQPVATSSEDFTTINYILSGYYKASRWMKKLEADLGQELFDKAMQSYFETWKFKHPYPEDLKAIFEKTDAKNIDKTFKLLYSTGSFNSTPKGPFKPSLLFNLKDQYRYISLAPATGYNHYDKVMAGAFVHNYTLPLPNLQYLAGVLYGTGSKQLNGFGRLSYNIYQRKYHFQTALSYISYSQNDFITHDNTKLISRIHRWVPSAKLTLFEKNPLSTRSFTIQFKTFLLKEGALNFKTIYTPSDTFDVVGIINNHSYINRLSFAINDNRELYPYSIHLTADQGKDFIKTGFTAKMFFNYPDGVSGMSVRFFAGKFIYLKAATSSVRFKNDRYFLNMTGPKGYEDYTYSDYFVGRNEFEGWQSQQIMQRDGFFKVNTELLGNKVGKTDNWLMAVNFSSGLPHKFNPLSVLPIKIPFKVFADIGTYAEAWKENALASRFIFDAGIQIPLLHSLIDVYIPIVYSKVYSNYYKSTFTEKRFLKTIAFTINISKLRMQEIVKDIPL